MVLLDMEKKIVVAENQAGQRIDALAVDIFDGELTRRQLQNNGTFSLRFNDQWIPKKGKSKVTTDQSWKVVYEEPKSHLDHLKPWNYALNILQETPDWLAINKPIDISVHPSASEKSDQTIVNALLHYFGNKFSTAFTTDDADENHVKSLRPGIIHRLDKVTSGVLLIAKNEKTLRQVQSQWQQTEKTYYAIVEGITPTKGKISGGIMRDASNRQRMMVSDSPKAKKAITFFEREATSEGRNLSLLKIKIPTGRTHQIRVHLSSIGFSILGDTLYGGRKSNRVFLHAQSLHFPDPTGTTKNITVKTNVPEQFLNFF